MKSLKQNAWLEIPLEAITSGVEAIATRLEDTYTVYIVVNSSNKYIYINKVDGARLKSLALDPHGLGGSIQSLAQLPPGANKQLDEKVLTITMQQAKVFQVTLCASGVLGWLSQVDRNLQRRQGMQAKGGPNSSCELIE